MSDRDSDEKTMLSFDSDNLGFSQNIVHAIIAAMIDGLTVIGLNGKILDCNNDVLKLQKRCGNN